MPRFGADESFASTTSGGVFDASGNPVISADNEFGGSPLGPAALAQTLFSVANGTFNLLPPTVEEPISNENLLPYWSVPIDNSDGVMTAKVIFDTTTNTYALRMTPGTAASGDTLSITTRSAVISDDNLSLRQKAIATLEKVGTYAGTTQVNLKLDATYYDYTGTQLSTQAIGTVFDNGTVSSITGFTTAGTAAVGISAAYVDLTFTLTATAAVTSGIAFDINTILLQTSQGAGGGQSFLVTEAFASSGTWTRPTGVNYLVAVAGYSGGNGGDGGEGRITRTGGSQAGIPGNPGAYGLLRDVYVGDVASVSVGIGAGGAGGAGGTATKAVGTAAGTIAGAGASGGVGGNTTFGSYLVCSPNASNSVGAVSGTVTATVPFVDTILTSVAYTEGTATAVSNSSLETSGFTILPYQTVYAAAGGNGTNGTALGATTGGKISTLGGVRTLGGTAGIAGLAMSMGGVGSRSRIDSGGGYAYTGSTIPSTSGTYYGGSANKGGAGGGGGAGVYFLNSAATAVSANGGNGGSASANSGSGGGAGGPAMIGLNATTAGGTTIYVNSSGTAIGGNGGNGGSGYLVVAYIA